MCNLSEGIVDRVTAEVTKNVTETVTKEVTIKNRVESVKNLMLTTGWQVEQAMAALRIPESMWPGIRKALAN